MNQPSTPRDALQAALSFLQLGHTVGLGNVDDDIVDRLEDQIRAALALSERVHIDTATTVSSGDATKAATGTSYTIPGPYAPQFSVEDKPDDKREKVDPNAEEWWQDSSLGDSELADMLGAHSWFHHGEPNPTALLMREAATRIRKLSALSARRPNVLKEVSSEWQTDRNENQVTCHSRMIGGVLCRWWGEETPAGVAAIDAASRYVGEKK